MQLIPGPRLENAFMLVRDRRGIQLINLKKGTSHMFMLSPVPVQYTDIRFFDIVYDEANHNTSLISLYYEDYPDELVNSLNMSGAADREGNKPLLTCYTFNREF